MLFSTRGQGLLILRNMIESIVSIQSGAHYFFVDIPEVIIERTLINIVFADTIVNLIGAILINKD